MSNLSMQDIRRQRESQVLHRNVGLRRVAVKTRNGTCCALRWLRACCRTVSALAGIEEVCDVSYWGLTSVHLAGSR